MTIRQMKIKLAYLESLDYSDTEQPFRRMAESRRNHTAGILRRHINQIEETNDNHNA